MKKEKPKTLRNRDSVVVSFFFLFIFSRRHLRSYCCAWCLENVQINKQTEKKIIVSLFAFHLNSTNESVLRVRLSICCYLYCRNNCVESFRLSRSLSGAPEPCVHSSTERLVFMSFIGSMQLKSCNYTLFEAQLIYKMKKIKTTRKHKEREREWK